MHLHAGLLTLQGDLRWVKVRSTAPKELLVLARPDDALYDSSFTHGQLNNSSIVQATNAVYCLFTPAFPKRQ